MRSNKKHFLRLFSSFLILTFAFEQLGFAAGDLKPIRFSSASEKIHLSYSIPSSVARIEDSFKAPSGSKTVFLLQDAHTNESGQLNLAGTLDVLMRNEKEIRYVFTEAAVGDNSLSVLRSAKPLAERQKLARLYIRKGLLHGVEYLDLTSEHTFTIWGVENPELYVKSLENYRAVAKDRERFEAYLKKIRAAHEMLSNRLLSPALKSLLADSEAFESGKLSLTDYFEYLSREATLFHVDMSGFKSLTLMRELKARETVIDFEKANQEEAKAVESLSLEDRQTLSEVSIKAGASTLSSGLEDPKEGYFALLEEKLSGKGAEYPELFKYFDYMKAAKKIEAAHILDEMKKLQASVFDAAATSEDEKTFIGVSRMIRLYEKLFRMTMVPSEYAEYNSLKASLGVERLTGFLNKKIMDLGTYYDRALFLESGYEDMLKSCESFYDLTHERDRSFIENMMKKMDETSQKKAALITGGFHTANLKVLLREKGISYVSLMPQVVSETNQANYEKILLGQTFSGSALIALPTASTMLMPTLEGYSIHGGAQVLPTNNGARMALEQFVAVRDSHSITQPTSVILKTSGARLSAADVKNAIEKLGFYESLHFFQEAMRTPEAYKTLNLSTNALKDIKSEFPTLDLQAINLLIYESARNGYFFRRDNGIAAAVLSRMNSLIPEFKRRLIAAINRVDTRETLIKANEIFNHPETLRSFSATKKDTIILFQQAREFSLLVRSSKLRNGGMARVRSDVLTAFSAKLDELSGNSGARLADESPKQLLDRMLEKAGILQDGRIADLGSMDTNVNGYNANAGGLRELKERTGGALKFAETSPISETATKSEEARFMTRAVTGALNTIIFAAGRATRMKLPNSVDDLGIAGLTPNLLKVINNLRGSADNATMDDLEKSSEFQTLLHKARDGIILDGGDLSLAQRQILQLRYQYQQLVENNLHLGISLKSLLENAHFTVIVNASNKDAIAKQLAMVGYAGLKPENVYLVLQREVGGYEIGPDGSLTWQDEFVFPEGHGKPFIDINLDAQAAFSLDADGNLRPLGLPLRDVFVEKGIERSLFAQVNDLLLSSDIASVTRWSAAEALMDAGSEMVVETVDNSSLRQKGGGTFEDENGHAFMRDTIAMKVPGEFDNVSIPSTISRMFYFVTTEGLSRLSGDSIPAYLNPRDHMGKKLMTYEYYSGDATSAFRNSKAIMQPGLKINTMKEQKRIPVALDSIAAQDAQSGFLDLIKSSSGARLAGVSQELVSDLEKGLTMAQGADFESTFERAVDFLSYIERYPLNMQIQAIRNKLAQLVSDNEGQPPVGSPSLSIKGNNPGDNYELLEIALARLENIPNQSQVEQQLLHIMKDPSSGLTQERISDILDRLNGGKIQLKGEQMDAIKLVNGREETIGQLDGKLIHEARLLHRTSNAFVLTPEGKFVIQRRVHNKAEAQRLSIYGGHVRAGETYEAGIRHELEEELGLIQGKELEGTLTVVGQEGQFSSPENDKINRERRSLYLYRATPNEMEHIRKERDRVRQAKSERTPEEFQAWILEEQKKGLGSGEIWDVYELTYDELLRLGDEANPMTLKENFSDGEKSFAALPSSDLLAPMLKDKSIIGSLSDHLVGHAGTQVVTDGKKSRLVLGRKMAVLEVAGLSYVIKVVNDPDLENLIMYGHKNAVRGLGNLVVPLTVTDKLSVTIGQNQINKVILQEKIMPANELMAAYLKENKTEMAVTLLKKMIENDQEITRRGYILTDWKVANYGVTARGEILLLDPSAVVDPKQPPRGYYDYFMKNRFLLAKAGSYYRFYKEYRQSVHAKELFDVFFDMTGIRLEVDMRDSIIEQVSSDGPDTVAREKTRRHLEDLVRLKRGLEHIRPFVPTEFTEKKVDDFINDLMGGKEKSTFSLQVLDVWDENQQISISNLTNNYLSIVVRKNNPSGSRLAGIPASAFEVEAGVRYFNGTDKTTAIERPFRPSKKEDAVDIASMTESEGLELEGIGARSILNGEGYISELIAGASSRMNPAEAPADAKALVGGKDIQSKAAVPIGRTTDGHVSTYIGEFAENLARFFTAINEEAARAGISGDAFKNDVGFMTNDQYRPEHDALLSQNNYFGLKKEQIHMFHQPLGAKFVATEKDTEKIKSNLDARGVGAYNEAIAQSQKVTADIVAGKSESVILEGERDPLGHGEFFHQLIATGEILRIRDSGKKWILVKNVDNYASKFDKTFLRILGLFLKQNLDFQPEVSPRSPGQKGGSLIVMEDNGAHQLAEDPNITATNDALKQKGLPPVMGPTDSYWFNDAVGLATLSYAINPYKLEGQSDEDFFKELASANADERQAIADRGRRKFPKIFDTKPAKSSNTGVVKGETNLWQSTGVVSQDMKIKAVGVRGIRNIPIEEYKKLPFEERMKLLGPMRFLSTKNWTKSAEEVAKAKGQLEKDLGRPVTNDELWVTLETYQGNKIIADDILRYNREAELVTPGIFSGARLATVDASAPYMAHLLEGIGENTPDWQRMNVLMAILVRTLNGKMALRDLLSGVNPRLKDQGIEADDQKIIDLLKRLTDIGLVKAAGSDFSLVPSKRLAAVKINDVEFIRDDIRNSMNDLASLLREYSEITDLWHLYPVEAKWPVEKAIALLDKEEQMKVVEFIRTHPETHKYELVNFIGLILDNDIPLDWVEKNAAELIGRNLFYVSPETWAVAGGLGRVGQYHAIGMKSLVRGKANVATVEPYYPYKLNFKGEEEPVDYTKLPVPVEQLSHVPVYEFEIPVRGRMAKAQVYKGVNKYGIEVYLIKDPKNYYTRLLYIYGLRESASFEEFTEFFNRASLDLILILEREKMAKEKKSYKAPVISLNDGQLGLFPAYKRMADESPDPSRQVLKDAFMLMVTHTYRNRGIYGQNNGFRFLVDAGVPERFHRYYQRIGQIDATSGARRLADATSAVALVHSDEVAPIDPGVRGLAITNGDNLEASGKVFRAIFEELYPNEDFFFMTSQQLIHVKEVAKQRVATDPRLTQLDPEISNLRADQPVIGYFGRLVSEKVGRDRAFTNENIGKMVEAGVQVILAANVQSHTQSMLNDLRELQKQVNAPEKAGRLIVLNGWSLPEQISLLAATDVQVQDSDRGTEAAGFTESDASVNGALQLAPAGLEGILQNQGIILDRERPGSGNTLIPDSEQPGSYWKVYEWIVKQFHEDHERFSTYQTASVRLSRVLNARVTAAAYLIKFSNGIDRRENPVRVLSDYLRGDIQAKDALMSEWLRKDLAAALAGSAQVVNVPTDNDQVKVFVWDDQGTKRLVLVDGSYRNGHDVQTFVHLKEILVDKIVGTSSKIDQVLGVYDAQTGQLYGEYSTQRLKEDGLNAVIRNPGVQILNLKLQAAGARLAESRQSQIENMIGALQSISYQISGIGVTLTLDGSDQANRLHDAVRRLNSYNQIDQTTLTRTIVLSAPNLPQEKLDHLKLAWRLIGEVLRNQNFKGSEQDRIGLTQIQETVSKRFAEDLAQLGSEFPERVKAQSLKTLTLEDWNSVLSNFGYVSGVFPGQRQELEAIRALIQTEDPSAIDRIEQIIPQISRGGFEVSTEHLKTVASLLRSAWELSGARLADGIRSGNEAALIAQYSPVAGQVPSLAATDMKLIREMVRDYDYRSRGTEDLSPTAMFLWGVAQAQMALDRAQRYGVVNRTVLLARDARKIKTELLEAFAAGLLSQGLSVVYISAEGPNAVTSYSWAVREVKPLMSVFYTSSHVVAKPGEKIMGMKTSIIDDTGELSSLTTLEIKDESLKMITGLSQAAWASPQAAPGKISALTVDENTTRQNILIGRIAALSDVANEITLNALDNDFAKSDSAIEVLDRWEQRVPSDFKPFANVRVTIDAAHTPSGYLAAGPFEALGATVTVLNSDIQEVEGPHKADPSKKANLIELKQRMTAEKSLVGLAFDLDGDRGAIIIRTGPGEDLDRDFMILPPDNLMAAMIPFLRKEGGYSQEQIAFVRDVLSTEGVDVQAASHEALSEITDAGYIFLKARAKELKARGFQAPMKGERSGHAWISVAGDYENPVAVALIFAAMAVRYQETHPESKNPYWDVFKQNTVPYLQSARFQPKFADAFLGRIAQDPRNDTGWAPGQGTPNQKIIAVGRHLLIETILKDFAPGRAFQGINGELVVQKVLAQEPVTSPDGFYRYADIQFVDAAGQNAGRFVIRASSNDPTWVAAYETPVRPNESLDSQAVADRYQSIAGVVLGYLETNQFADILGFDYAAVDDQDMVLQAHLLRAYNQEVPKLKDQLKFFNANRQRPGRVAILDDKITLSQFTRVAVASMFPALIDNRVSVFQQVVDFEAAFDKAVQEGNPYELLFISTHLHTERHTEGITGVVVLGKIREKHKAAGLSKSPLVVLVTTNPVQSVGIEANQAGVILFDGNTIVYDGEQNYITPQALSQIRAAVYQSDPAEDALALAKRAAVDARDTNGPKLTLEQAILIPQHLEAAHVIAKAMTDDPLSVSIDTANLALQTLHEAWVEIDREVNPEDTSLFPIMKARLNRVNESIAKIESVLRDSELAENVWVDQIRQARVTILSTVSYDSTAQSIADQLYEYETDTQIDRAALLKDLNSFSRVFNADPKYADASREVQSLKDLVSGARLSTISDQLNQVATEINQYNASLNNPALADGASTIKEVAGLLDSALSDTTGRSLPLLIEDMWNTAETLETQAPGKPFAGDLLRVITLLKETQGLSFKTTPPGARLAKEKQESVVSSQVSQLSAKDFQSFFVGVALAQEAPIKTAQGTRLSILFDLKDAAAQIFGLKIEGKELLVTDSLSQKTTRIAYQSAQTDTKGAATSVSVSTNDARKLLVERFHSEQRILELITDINKTKNVLYRVAAGLLGSVGQNPALDALLLQALEKAKSDKYFRLTVSDRATLADVMEYARQKEIELELKPGLLTGLFSMQGFIVEAEINILDPESPASVPSQGPNQFNIFVRRPEAEQHGLMNFALPVSAAMARVGKKRLNDDNIVTVWRSAMDPSARFDTNTFVRLVSGQETDRSIWLAYSQLPLLSAIHWNDVFHLASEWLKSVGRSA